MFSKRGRIAGRQHDFTFQLIPSLTYRETKKWPLVKRQCQIRTHNEDFLEQQSPCFSMTHHLSVNKKWIWMSRSHSFSLLYIPLVLFLAIRYNLVYAIAFPDKYATASSEMGNYGACLCKRVKGEAMSFCLPLSSHSLHLSVFHICTNIFLLPSLCSLSFAGSERHGRL